MSEKLPTEAMTTDEQLKRFGCDLIDLLRREGLHSNAWFRGRLLQAADVIEQAARPTDAVERVAIAQELRALHGKIHEGRCLYEEDALLIGRAIAALTDTTKDAAHD